MGILSSSGHAEVPLRSVVLSNLDCDTIGKNALRRSILISRLKTTDGVQRD